MIVAAASNNAIGRNNELLWRLPADMKFFKNTTWAMPVIMGRKTFEALGKPLSGRYNIVISRNAEFKSEGVVRVDDLDTALEAADAMKTKEIFIIGGGQVYEQAMPVANRIYLTRVHAELEGDAFFPELNEKDWHIVSKNDFPKDEKHEYDYSFETWERND
jgi:dihydrofolate reductase